jgi:hypothetical protein
MKEKIKNFLKKAIMFLLNPRLLLCFGIGWMITNGWSYILLVLGLWLQIGWMIAVAGAYQAFLWFPFTPEKIVTFAIAMWLMKVLFPNDTKTLGVLRETYAKLKAALAVKRTEHKEKKVARAHKKAN